MTYFGEIQVSLCPVVTVGSKYGFFQEQACHWE